MPTATKPAKRIEADQPITPRCVDEDCRESEYGNKIGVAQIRAFLRSALGDDAVVEGVNELIFEHVVGGRFHPSVVATSLPHYIEEIMETATIEDWEAVAGELIAECQALEGEGEH